MPSFSLRKPRKANVKIHSLAHKQGFPFGYSKKRQKGSKGSKNHKQAFLLAIASTGNRGGQRGKRQGKQMYVYVYLFIFIYILFYFILFYYLQLFLRALPDSNRRLYFKVLVFKTSALNQTRPSTLVVNMPQMFEFEYNFCRGYLSFLFLFVCCLLLFVCFFYWLRFLLIYFLFCCFCLFFIFYFCNFCLCFPRFCA